MGRILAFDYGEKRTGIAITDELQIIASGLTTIDTKKIFSFLTDYFKKENVDLFVIGEPKQMNNTASESEQFIQPFIQKLRLTFPKIPIKRVDERFTSKMAFQSMIDSGLKKKQRQNKELIDEIIEENVFLFSGRLDVEYINQKYNLNIPESDSYITLGGFIVNNTKEIPQNKEKIIIDNFEITIHSASNKKIELVRLSILEENQ